MQVVSHTFYWLHLIIFLIFVIMYLANAYAFFERPSYNSGITIILLSIGAMQPALALAKQHALDTLNSISHYYYFYGVICFCSFGLLINNFSRQHQRSILTASCITLACLLTWKPEYLSRPFLIPMDWPRFAEEISSADQDVVVPLNPNWRTVIPRARPHDE